MPKSYTYIVASLHGRTGKTLLARLLADHAILQGTTPRIFDTDIVEKKLTASFPDKSIVVDLEKVTDQMKLFDTLLVCGTGPSIVDLTHRSFSKFFKLLIEMNFVPEAKSNDIETLIFYIPDRETDSYREGVSLLELFKDCSIVVVENALLGEPSDNVRRSYSYNILMQNDLYMRLPALDPMFVNFADDEQLSFSEFIGVAEGERLPQQQSLAYLSLEVRSSIRSWLADAFAEIARITDIMRMRAEKVFKQPF